MAIVEQSHEESALTTHEEHHYDGHISTEQHNEMLKFGWWLFIASEVMLFSSLIGVLLLAKRLFPEEQEVLAVPITTVGTFILLTSSWMFVRALASLQQGNVVGLQRGLFLTFVLGATFLGIQAYEYTVLAHEGLTVSSGMYGGAFYVLTGFHGFHVLIGLIWLLWAFFQSIGGRFSAENYIGIEILGLYWHFVDVVWVLLFSLIYLM